MSVGAGGKQCVSRCEGVNALGILRCRRQAVGIWTSRKQAVGTWRCSR